MATQRIVAIPLATLNESIQKQTTKEKIRDKILSLFSFVNRSSQIRNDGISISHIFQFP